MQGNDSDHAAPFNAFGTNRSENLPSTFMKFISAAAGDDAVFLSGLALSLARLLRPLPLPPLRLLRLLPSLLVVPTRLLALIAGDWGGDFGFFGFGVRPTGTEVVGLAYRYSIPC
jgi:hypothetical protein